MLRVRVKSRARVKGMCRSGGNGMGRGEASILAVCSIRYITGEFAIRVECTDTGMGQSGRGHSCQMTMPTVIGVRTGVRAHAFHIPIWLSRRTKIRGA